MSGSWATFTHFPTGIIALVQSHDTSNGWASRYIIYILNILCWVEKTSNCTARRVAAQIVFFFFSKHVWMKAANKFIQNIICLHMFISILMQIIRIKFSKNRIFYENSMKTPLKKSCERIYKKQLSKNYNKSPPIFYWNDLRIFTQ